MIDLNAWAPAEVTDNADAGSKVLFRDYAADYVEKRCKVNNEPIQQTTKEKYQQYLRDYLNPVWATSPWLPSGLRIFASGTTACTSPRMAAAKAFAGMCSNCWTASCRTRPMRRWTIPAPR